MGRGTSISQGAEPPAHPAEACAILIKCYRDGAGAEALLRAFLAERDCNRPAARFWIAVYGMIVEKTKQSQGGLS